MDDLTRSLKLNQITNRELFLDFKETYLNLQRALLKANLFIEMKEVGDNYKRAKEILSIQDPSS